MVAPIGSAVAEPIGILFLPEAAARPVAMFGKTPNACHLQAAAGSGAHTSIGTTVWIKFLKKLRRF